MAALDVVGAIANVKSMLSNLTAWQTMCGVATAALAAERIIEGGTDEEEDVSLTPCIFLDVTSLPMNWLAHHFRGDFVVEIACEFEIPEENRATYAAQYLYAWEFFSDMLAGINGAVGGAGQLMVSRLEVPQKPGRMDDNTNHGRVEWIFVLALVFDLR